MLINLSNHPLDTWSVEQITQANLKYGEIFDINFPSINPKFSSKKIIVLAKNYLKMINEIFLNRDNEKNAVHLMGEFTFVFALATLLTKNEITVIASTSNRNTIDLPNGKIVTFEFIQFREYKY